jgi:hypothetical protein
VSLVIGPIFSQIKNPTSYSASYAGSAYQAAPYASKTAYDNATVGLSARNVTNEEFMGEAVYNNSDAGAMEVKEYSATIETGNLEKTCGIIVDLKGRDYIIFEGSNVNDNNCYFTFKVKRENVQEILAIINSLNPRDLSENAKSIKRQIEDFTSQEDILKEKLASIDETMNNALVAYNEISALATKTNNADSLAKVIDSKINMIERLTQERINISAQLESLSRIKALELEKLEYTYFYVNIYENKIFDLQYIKDSWVSSAKQFVIDVNRIFEDLSIRLVTLSLSAFTYLVYLFVILIVVKYCWRFGKYIWKK